MPGTRLSTVEKALETKWGRPAAYPYPLLDSIEVSGVRELRGIKQLKIPFSYPLIAIAGKNGTGKSTILALAALAFHAPEGHIARGAKAGNWAGRGYYTFKDFIFRGPSDPDLAGIHITWRYKSKNGESSIPITKRSDKWMHYERRPNRPVHFVGVSRCVPAIEASVLRSRFRHGAIGMQNVAVSQRALSMACEVLGRTYTRAATLASGSHTVRTCTTGSSYSSFNMGAGEDIVLELIALVESAPEGSLIVIEEVELGLHSEAVRRLARALIKLASDKNLQVIVSTHSEAFLDEIPREARLLIQKIADQHEIIKCPTTRFCLCELSGMPHDELFVYCEDNVAASILAEALPTSISRRVSVLPIGSDSELANARYVHKKQGLRQRALILWDGEVSDAKIRGWLRERLKDREVDLADVSFTRLPGGVKPETFLLDMLNCQAGYNSLATELKCSQPEAQDHVEALRALEEAKEAAFRLHERTGISEGDAWDRIVRAAVRSTDAPFASTIGEIQAVLEGQTVQILEALPAA